MTSIIYWSFVFGDEWGEYAKFKALKEGLPQSDIDACYKSTTGRVQRRWLQCISDARKRLAATGRKWNVNAHMVLAQVLLCGYYSEICCSGQGNIGDAVALSRQKVNGWIGKLVEAGVLAALGYEYRGVCMTEDGKPILWKGKPLYKRLKVPEYPANVGFEQG